MPKKRLMPNTSPRMLMSKKPNTKIWDLFLFSKYFINSLTDWFNQNKHQSKSCMSNTKEKPLLHKSTDYDMFFIGYLYYNTHYLYYKIFFIESKD